MSVVAITVKAPGGLDAEMDPRFGRAGAFLLVELPSGEIVAEIANDAADAAHGAGTGAAALMSKHGVAAVISGRFGPKAYQALEALDIEMWLAPPRLDARTAIARFEEGSLPRMMLQRL